MNISNGSITKVRIGKPPSAPSQERQRHLVQRVPPLQLTCDEFLNIVADGVLLPRSMGRSADYAEHPVAPDFDEAERVWDATPAHEQIVAIAERLEKIENMLNTLVNQRMVKEWYSTDEVAEVLGKAKFTVREWCRFRRVHASKRRCGRGQSHEWMIAHAELERIHNEGLLPLPKH